MPLMKKGCISMEPVFFPTPTSFDVHQNIPLAIQFKQCKCLCTNIGYFMYNKEMGGGKMEEQRKLYCSSQDVVGPICSFHIENVFLVWRNRALEESSRFPSQQTPAVCCWSTVIVSSSSKSSCTGVSVSLIGCPSNRNPICLIEKPCHSQQALSSFLSGVCLLMETAAQSHPAPAPSN